MGFDVNLDGFDIHFSTVALLAQGRDFIYTAKYNLKSFIPVNVKIRDNDDSKVVINAAQPPRVTE